MQEWKEGILGREEVRGRGEGYLSIKAKRGKRNAKGCLKMKMRGGGEGKWGRGRLGCMLKGRRQDKGRQT